MAHTRRTTPENKPSDPGSGQTEYAVLVANRAPHGQRTTVHLVCLEGMAKYLPGDGQSLPAGTKYIRVVSLKSWQFTATQEKVSFEGLLRKVIDQQSDPKHRGTLRLPNPEPSIEPVTNALEMGYVAFPHQTRFGASTVSWYRGPLVPFAANASNRLTKPANNADALLRYNPSTGMFDASYSAAWQLGRLLALHDKEFAVALYQWKHANQTSPAPLPDVVSNWLGRLVLLYGVPFNYLVPDERMLPPESLRFFEIDPLWMDCLMDGAYSIGRSTSTVATNDELMLDTIRQNAIDAARKQRANWLNQAGGGLVPGSRGSTISGFLLRSEVVKAYPGMNVRAFAGKDVTDETNQTAILRLESISPSVLLGLFDGSFGHLAIRRAPEAMHFGLDVKDDTSFYKVLRNVRSGDPSTSLPVTLRDGSKQVIQLDKLASSMAGPLGVTKVTSDIFALEMIEGAHEVFFIQS
jgi:hypothetical protein